MGNLKATNSGEARELIPAKNYLGIVSLVCDLGTQDGGSYGAKHQILISWELHSKRGPVRDKEGRVLTISNFYTLSFNEKANLRADVQSLLNRQFSEAEAKAGYDVEELLGKACRLQVVHKPKLDGTMKDLVGSIQALDEDDDEPKAELSDVYFEITGPKCEIPKGVPEWVSKIIQKSPEWTGKAAATSAYSEPSGARRPAAAPVGAGAARGPVNNTEFDDDDPNAPPY